MELDELFVDGARSSPLRADAAAFLRRVLPGDGVADGGVFCSFRYSWSERWWKGPREEVELCIECCEFWAECTGVA